MRSRYHRYLDPDDQAQEAELARLVAARSGADPDRAARRAVARADKAEQRHRARFATNYGPADEPAFHLVAEDDRLVGRPRSEAEARKVARTGPPAHRPRPYWRAIAEGGSRREAAEDAEREARERAARDAEREAVARRDRMVAHAAACGLDESTIAGLFGLAGPSDVQRILGTAC